MERHHEFRIELFVFPDGTGIEVMVFDGAGDAAPIGEYHVRDRAPEPKAPPAPGTAPSPRTAPSPCAAQAPSAVPSPPATPATGREARLCPLCGCEHVYPLDWQRRSENTWMLRLRCPNCETLRDVLMDRPGVEALNRELYRAHQAVEEQSRSMARRNFEDEAARIVAALASGLIQPMDF